MQFNLADGTLVQPYPELVMLPAVIIAIVSLLGFVCVLSERRKAKGHWADMKKFR